MKKFICSSILFLWFTASMVMAESQLKEESKPNIIFILTDDLGYGDLGVLFQNHRKTEGKPFHSTPYLDKMAGEGMLLTRHYVPAPVCAPSRASLLLGLHQGHAAVRNNQFDKALPDNHTLASVLKEAGYATALVGKYGLQGTEGNSPDTWEAYPTKRGFDYFFGYVRHRDGHNHYPAHEAPERPPVELYDGNEEISSKLKGCYTTDLFTARAKKYITDHKSQQPEQPFFLYLAYDTPHAGLQVASTPYPEGSGLNGGVQWRGEPGNYINTVTDEVDGYIHPDYADQDWPDVNKRFGSMVRRIDNAVEDLLQLLKDLDIDEETLIVFSSDNGPHHESYGYGDYAPTFFESYGNLDGTKRDTWEGGIRVPTIVRWPGVIAAGSQNDTPTMFHDWLSTFAQLADIPAPANTDGVSLVPLLTGENAEFQGRVYVEYSVGGETPDYNSFHESHKGQKRGEMQGIYLDGYKGIRYNIQSHSDDFRIYDTKTDPQEIMNLAGSNDYYRKLQERMKKKVLQWRRPNETAARPYDNTPIPAVEMEHKLNSGLNYHLFNIDSPWTPEISSIEMDPEENGISKVANLKHVEQENNFVLVYEGYLEVGETGAYSFNLETQGGAIMHLHQAMVFDADKGYSQGERLEAMVMLEKGYHPFKLVYSKRNQVNPMLQIKWSGPGFSEQNIQSSSFFH
ncbi:MAG: sulfatase-like hydrolase/transferase [Anditalea sp.]